jgi:glucokinase
MTDHNVGGRPAKGAWAKALMVVGADIGGTKVSTVLVDGGGVVRHRTWAEHSARSFDEILAAVGIAVAESIEVADRLGGEVCGFGAAVAAWLSPDRERILVGANIGAGDHDVAGALRRSLGMPVVVENDGNATALAEHWAAGAVSRCLVVLTLGTGVGGGIVMDGRLLSGASGLAGELGHLPVTEAGGLCCCGGRGCLELSASGPAIAAAGGAASTAEVVAAARAGSTEALLALGTAGRAIGVAVSRLVPVVDPDLVVLSGSIAHAASDYLVPAALSALHEDRPLSVVGSAPRVELGRLGPHAAAIGAARLALSQRGMTPATVAARVGGAS